MKLTPQKIIENLKPQPKGDRQKSIGRVVNGRLIINDHKLLGYYNAELKRVDQTWIPPVMLARRGVDVCLGVGLAVTSWPLALALFAVREGLKFGFGRYMRGVAKGIHRTIHLPDKLIPDPAIQEAAHQKTMKKVQRQVPDIQKKTSMYVVARCALGGAIIATTGFCSPVSLLSILVVGVCAAHGLNDFGQLLKNAKDDGLELQPKEKLELPKKNWGLHDYARFHKIGQPTIQPKIRLN